MFSDNTPLGVHENSTSIFFKLVLTKVSIIGIEFLENLKKLQKYAFLQKFHLLKL